VLESVRPVALMRLLPDDSLSPTKTIGSRPYISSHVHVFNEFVASMNGFVCVKVGYGAIFLSEHHVITNAFDALNQELIRKTRRHNTRRPGHASLVRPPSCCIPGRPNAPTP
jgi:hypothetical protein